MDVLERQELHNKDIDAIRELMEADIVNFTDGLAALKTTEEVKAKEEELMEIFKADDEYLSGLDFKLSDKTEYAGKTVKRSELIRNIIGFISRIEVDFRATLGIYQAILFWKTCGTDNVPYTVYDTTLRLLGTIKYKGADDCFNILAINNWFTEAHEAYMRANVYTGYLSSLHQAIMTRLSELDPKEVAEGEQPVAE